MSESGTACGPFSFEVIERCHESAARLGKLRTPHGSAPTPAFMPVGTAGSVKGVEPEHLRRAGCRLLLCNSYHLVLRPGDEVVRDLGGLHSFMRWDGPILTDSGGYQVFSLADLTQVDAEGVTFKSHLDGQTLRLTPERAVEIQLNLGSDIMMVFDECLPHEAPRTQVVGSLAEHTVPWARRSLALHPRDGRALFAIGQGGLFADLRQECLQALADMPFDGFAVGGLSVGESKEDLRSMLAASMAVAPEEKPRYLMGVGSPLEILDAVVLGVDLFDCVLPTRNARNAAAFTDGGVLRLRNARYARDANVLEVGCPCAACRAGFSRAYLRHLLMAREILGPVLTSVHNLTFMERFMQKIRAAILKGTFQELCTDLRARWMPVSNDRD